MNYPMLREVVKAMADGIVTLIKKDDKAKRYIEGKTQYERNGQIVSTDGYTVLSGSDSEYYLLEKKLKFENRAKFEQIKMAVKLRNTENRFSKHGSNVFEQLNKIVDLLGGDQPCDPVWVQDFLNGLAQCAQTIQTVGEQNARRYENWEPATESAKPAGTKVVWRPV